MHKGSGDSPTSATVHGALAWAQRLVLPGSCDINLRRSSFLKTEVCAPDNASSQPVRYYLSGECQESRNLSVLCHRFSQCQAQGGYSK
jgi:hypothetical protein